jgi:adenine-specific DNA-methyltransferase
MVIGEPDIELKPTDGSQLTPEIHGLDVYDPTTGAVRSSSVDDIAAWFVDTDYDGDAFFVRHAYFTGADDSYDKLRRALKADITDEAWATANLDNQPAVASADQRQDRQGDHHCGETS